MSGDHDAHEVAVMLMRRVGGDHEVGGGGGGDDHDAHEVYEWGP